MQAFWQVRRKVLALLLVIGLTPSVAELIEWGVHLVRHGDFAHADSGSHSQKTDSEEHGCSTLFHACSCHASSLSTPAGAPRLVVNQPPPSGQRQASNRDGRCGRGAEPPPLPPPIA